MINNYEVSKDGKVLKKVTAKTAKDAVKKAMATGLNGYAFKDLVAEKVL